MLVKYLVFTVCKMLFDCAVDCCNLHLLRINFFLCWAFLHCFFCSCPNNCFLCCFLNFISTIFNTFCSSSPFSPNIIFFLFLKLIVNIYWIFFFFHKARCVHLWLLSDISNSIYAIYNWCTLFFVETLSLMKVFVCVTLLVSWYLLIGYLTPNTSVLLVPCFTIHFRNRVASGLQLICICSACLLLFCRWACCVAFK